MTTHLQPDRALGIILGASAWPHFPGLDASDVFKNSADDFCAWLEQDLGIPRDNVLWLFDEEKLAQADVDTRIRRFLADRTRNTKKADGENSCQGDVFLFFTGHGRIAPTDRKFQLILHSTHKENVDASGYRMYHLVKSLNDHVRFFRRWVFLDCCFSGAAHVEFMPQTSESAALVRDEIEENLPRKGTALFAACNGNTFALAPTTQRLTMFSAALLEVLRRGDPQYGEAMSLEEVAESVQGKIQNAHLENAVRPELSLPDQSQGSIAKIPMFPNPARRAVGESLGIKMIQDRLDQLIQCQERLRKPIESMLDHLTWKVTDLEKCQEDLLARLARLSGKEPVEIRHLGLDLFKATNKMEQMLKSHFAIKSATLKILVITDDPDRLGSRLPPSVRIMTKRVSAGVDDLKNLVQGLDRDYQSRGQHLAMEVRSYSELPTIHGFSLYEGQSHIATYCSFCRWVRAKNKKTRKEYEDINWGGNRYRCILGTPDDLSLRDMKDIFDGVFAHLWKNSKNTFKDTIGKKVVAPVRQRKSS